jgi:hypothetical protein
MDLKKLNESQRAAILDTFILGMYADAHLTRAEDARVERLLGAMGFSAKFERDREFDAAVTRVRKHADPVTANREVSQHLAKAFSSGADRNQVIHSLTELIGSDSNVSVEETRFLETIKATFLADRLDPS